MSLTIWQIDPAQMTPYYNLALCDALAQKGTSVRYVTSQYLYDPDLPIPDSIEIDFHYFRQLNHPRLLNYPRLRKSLRGFSYIIGHSSLLQKIKRHHPDIVHFQWSRLPRIDFWLVRRIQALGIPVVHTVHDVVPLFMGETPGGALRQIYQSSDALIVHSYANRESFLATYPAVPANKVHVIPIIAPGNATQPRGADQVSARKELGLPLDAPVVLFFGTIKAYKGLDILVEAYRIAQHRCPDLHLVVAGNPDIPSDIPPQLSRGQLPNILLQLGYIPGDEIWKYHLAADVVVFPYRHIYQSGALTTAMAYGLPAIVTDVGGLPEAIDGNGWVVPTENPAALAAALLEAVRDQDRLRQMGRRSLELMATRFSGQEVTSATLELYKQLLAR